MGPLCSANGMERSSAGCLCREFGEEKRVAQMAVLFCPRCRCEYLARVSECADCGVALVPEHALEAATQDELPDLSELQCIRAASVGWAQGLSLRLSEAGISHRIEAAAEEGAESVRGEPGATLPYGVWVRDADLPAARQVDEDFLRSQIPDLPEELSDAEPAGDDQCPACGTAVSASAEECPDCGLVLVIAGD